MPLQRDYLMVWPYAYVRSLLPPSLSSRWQVSVGAPRLERVYLDDGTCVEMKDVSARLEVGRDEMLHLFLSGEKFLPMDKDSLKRLALELINTAVGERTALAVMEVTVLDDVPPEGRFPLSELGQAIKDTGEPVCDSVEDWMKVMVEYHDDLPEMGIPPTVRDDIWGVSQCPGLILSFLAGGYDENYPWPGMPFTTGFFAFPVTPLLDIRTMGPRMLAGLQELDPDTAWHLGFGVGHQYCYEDVFVWDLEAMLKAAKTWCRQEGLSGVWFQEHSKGSKRIFLTDEA